ncbi:putative glutamine amidotransferase sno3 [Maudiozyma exigua]|uniref:glutaminase n=1 Tax=Maudiozyma exigua TaxID=34358 RepID=A0A9P6WDH7_MAUEX|nr:putative glutamine amidotransferase sno3 [Kazachstania exigua]
MSETRCIGVLALQGAFIEHVHHLQRCIDKFSDYDKAIRVTTVRTAQELWQCDGLVIPGGESTAMSLIAQRTNLYDDLYRFVHDPNKCIWGTCAGLIFISDNLMTQGNLINTLKLLHVTVKRNAFGRQAQSFIQKCDFSNFIDNCNDFPATFIRAPVIDEILDPENVEVLYRLDKPDCPQDGLIVAVKQNDNILATSFHPELAEDDLRFHDYFIREFILKR